MLMQKKGFGTFLSGMLAGAMLLGCGTALAAGGGVQFGTVGLKTYSGKTVIESGDSIVNATGCNIPAAIVYTDEAGGDNTYIHIRTVGEVLELPVDYGDGIVYLGGKPGGLDDVTNTEFPTYHDPTALSAPGSKVSCYTEVEPYWPAREEITGIDENETHIISNGAYGSIHYDVNGTYLSLSITNNTEVDMRLLVYCRDAMIPKFEEFPSTLVPAGETVVRTFQMEEYTGYFYPKPICYSVDYVENSPLGPMPREKTDVTISAVSFETR